MVVHGVPEDTELPGTAASVAELPVNETIPIACAELVLVETAAR